MTPLCRCLEDAFDHRKQECNECNEAEESFCSDGYVFFDKTHNSYSPNRDSRAAKAVEPSSLLKRLAFDLVEGIEHTEREGFRDKTFKSNYKTWKKKHDEFMNNKERKFKERWERKKLKERIQMEEEMKAASDSKLEPPPKLRRTKQNRRVSQDTSDSSSSEEESDDSSVVSVYSDSS